MENYFGHRATDKVTKFKGVVTGKCMYITGCSQYLVQPGVSEDGVYRDSKWFDEDRLIFSVDPIVEITITGATGPDKPAPTK